MNKLILSFIFCCGFLGLSVFGNAANVLIIGDSLSAVEKYGLGSQLYEKFQKGNNVNMVASCGSSPWWYQSKKRVVKTTCGYLKKRTGSKTISATTHETPKLPELVKPKPDLAVIQQGTNLYGFLVGKYAKSLSAGKKSIRSSVYSFISELKDNAPNSACLWVAPPEITKYGGAVVSKAAKNAMYEAIKEGIADAKARLKYNCTIHDSRADTGPPGSRDGTHFNSTGQTKKWVDKVSSKAKVILANLNKHEGSGTKSH